MARNIDITVRVRDETEAVFAALEARVREFENRIQKVKQAAQTADPELEHQKRLVREQELAAQRLAALKQRLAAETAEQERRRQQRDNERAEREAVESERATQSEIQRVRAQAELLEVRRRDAQRREELRELREDIRTRSQLEAQARRQSAQEAQQAFNNEQRRRAQELRELRAAIQERARIAAQEERDRIKASNAAQQEQDKLARNEQRRIESRRKLRLDAATAEVVDRRRAVDQIIRELDRLERRENQIRESATRKVAQSSFRQPADLRREGEQIRQILAEREVLIQRSASQLEALNRANRSLGGVVGAEDIRGQRAFQGGVDSHDALNRRRQSLILLARDQDNLTRTQRAFQSILASSSGAVNSFINTLQNASGPLRTFGSLTQFAVVAMAPLIGGLVQLGAGLLAIGASALNAGYALGGAFVSGVAQAIPVVTLLVAAVVRAVNVFQLVNKLRDQEKQEGLAAEERAERAQNVADRQLDLERARARAREDLIRARQRSEENSALAIEQAQRRIARSQESLTDAQRDLIRAREDARRSLEVLSDAEQAADLRQRQAALGAISARLALRQARQRGDILGAASAQLGVAGAQLDVSRASRDAGNVARDQADVQEAAADRVEAAQRRVRDAQLEVFDASRSLSLVYRDNARAVDDQTTAYQRQLEQFESQQGAIDNARDSIDDTTAAARKLKQELQDLSPAQRELFENTDALLDVFDKNLQPIIDLLLKPFTEAIQNITAALQDPAFLTATRDLVTTLAEGLSDLVELFTGPEGREFLITFMENARSSAEIINNIFLGIGESLLNIGVAAGPVFRYFLETLDFMFLRLQVFTQDPERLSDFFERSRESLDAWFSLLGSVFDLLFRLGESGDDAGDSIVERFAGWLDTLDVNSSTFENAARGVGEFANALANLFAAIGDNEDENSLEKIGRVIDTLLIPVLENLLQISKDVTDVIIAILDLPLIGEITEWTLTLLVLSKTFGLTGLVVSIFSNTFVRLILIGALNAVISVVRNVVLAFVGRGALLAAFITVQTFISTSLIPIIRSLAISLTLLALNPVTLVITGILGIVAALVLLEAKFELISNILEFVGGKFEALWELLGFINPITTIIDHFSDMRDVIKDIIGLFTGDSSITDLLHSLFDLAIPQVLQDALNFVWEKLQDIRDVVSEILGVGSAPSIGRFRPENFGGPEDRAAGGYEVAKRGGRVLRLAEAGRDEVILSTDGRYANIADANFRRFLANADSDTVRKIRGAVIETGGGGTVVPTQPDRERDRPRPGGDPGAAGNRMNPIVSGAKWIKPWSTTARWSYGGGPGGGTHSRTENGYVWQDDDAIDVNMPMMTPILAVGPGKIGNVRSGGPPSSRYGGYGTYLSSQGQEFFYKHMLKMAVGSGDTVHQGAIIGWSGAGNSVPHLHFAARPPFNVLTVTGGSGGVTGAPGGAPIPYQPGGYTELSPADAPGAPIQPSKPTLWEAYTNWFQSRFGLRPARDSESAITPAAYARIARRLNPIRGKIMRLLGVPFEGDGSDPPASSTVANGVQMNPTSRGGTPAQNKVLGKAMLEDAGWSSNEWPALDRLWTNESGWNQFADNPTSDAYGIPQAMTNLHKLPADYGPPGGNPVSQITWGLNYIKSRYGSPSRALNFWNSKSPHWYATGIEKVGATGPAILHRDEMVLNPAQQAGIGSFIRALMNSAGGTPSPDAHPSAGNRLPTQVFNLPFGIAAPIVQGVSNLIERLARDLERATKAGNESKVRQLSQKIQQLRINAEARLNELVEALATMTGEFDFLRQQIERRRSLRDARARGAALGTFGEAGIRTDAGAVLANTTTNAQEIAEERSLLLEAQRQLQEQLKRKGIAPAARRRIEDALTNINNRIQDNEIATITAMEEQFVARRGVVEAEVNIVNQRAGLQNAAIDRRARLNNLRGNALASLQGRSGLLGEQGSVLRQQIAGLTASLGALEAIDPDAAVALREQIADLTTQLAENEAAIQSNTVEQIKARTSTVVGNQNFIGGLFSSVARAGQSVNDIFGDGSGNSIIREALGASASRGTTTRNQLLGQLASDFGLDFTRFSGPELIRAIAFQADQSGMLQFTDEQREAYNNLLQAIIDNENGLLDNTKALKDLENAVDKNTELQDFTSSSWDLFRVAVFNGLGGLQPNLPIPSMDTGGRIISDGFIYAHANEMVINPARVDRSVHSNGGVNVNFYGNQTPPDPVTFGRRIAWEMKGRR